MQWTEIFWLNLWLLLKTTALCPAPVTHFPKVLVRALSQPNNDIQSGEAVFIAASPNSVTVVIVALQLLIIFYIILITSSPKKKKKEKSPLFITLKKT